MKLGFKEAVAIGALALGGCEGSKQPVLENPIGFPGLDKVAEARQQCRDKALRAHADRSPLEVISESIQDWNSTMARVEKECLTNRCLTYRYDDIMGHN